MSAANTSTTFSPSTAAAAPTRSGTYAAPNAPARASGDTGIAPAVLDNLATRFRPCGLSLALLRTDGSMAWSDPTSGTFFQRFVLPQMQYPEAEGKQFVQALGTITAQSAVQVLSMLPGASIAVFPYTERRRLNGIFALAGKAIDFKLSEEVVRVCSRLGVDALWLNQQAEQLPTFNEDEIQRHARLLLSMVRDQVWLASLEGELAAVSTQLSNTYEELSLIYSLSAGTNVTRRPAEFFKQACLEVLQVVGVRGLGVALGPGSLQDHAPVLYGTMGLPPGTVQKLADELLVLLRARREPLLVSRLSSDRAFGWLSEHAQQMLAVPMMRGDTLLGCLFGLDKTSGEFDTVDIKLLTSIANESAIYLENARLFDDVRGLLMGLLHSLTSAVDAKDAYTCGHSERVALLSRLLAGEVGLSEPLIERIYMAGLLHDVGKIGVPENVLQKTGKLTDEEFKQMKRHPEIGARILRDIKQVADILPGVLHHHERYDGRGYPTGLAGKDIPLMGRLICVADCFDAMTSNRTYRKALPLEVALTEMRRCAGTQFDPELIDAFLRIGEAPLRELLLNHREESQRLLALTGGPAANATAATGAATAAPATATPGCAAVIGGVPAILAQARAVSAAEQALTERAQGAVFPRGAIAPDGVPMHSEAKSNAA
jgi:GAF domain-containing protein